MMRWLLGCAAVVAVGCGTAQPRATAPIAPAPEPAAEPVAAATPAAPATPAKQYSPGLEVIDTKVGAGAECKAGDKITVRYVGTLDDGTEFDKQADATFTIGAGMLIKGWDEGIPGMRVGGVRQLTIPASLAYGGKQVGKIPAYSTLHFEVELLAVNP